MRPRALVTGASSGIGRDFARELARRGHPLIITARREAELEELAQELRQAHHADVRVLSADLSQPGSAEALWQRILKEGLQVDLLVNNAGFGSHGAFLDLPLERCMEQLQLNLASLTALCHLAGQEMRRRGQGRILNVASVMGFFPTPYYATYAAGKAYVRRFSAALDHELKGSGVRVSCLSPGATDTAFAQKAGHHLPPWQRIALMPAAPVVALGLRLLEGGGEGVPGLMNKLTVLSVALTPNWLLMTVLALIFRGRR
jgi:short-subunit dehydrogenase